MWQQQQFKWLEVWCLIEHYVISLKVGLGNVNLAKSSKILKIWTLKVYLSIPIRIKAFGLVEMKWHLSKWRKIDLTVLVFATLNLV
jgi:hypothetical protein